jgi:hypothetical protein
MSRRSLGFALFTLVVCLSLVLGCGGSSDKGGSDYTAEDVTTALSAVSTALGSISLTSSGTTGGVTVTLNPSLMSVHGGISAATTPTIYSGTISFTSFSSGGLTLNGSITFTYDIDNFIMTLTGTINLSGDPAVASLTYNNITFDMMAYSMAGSVSIGFTDGSTATYDFTTGKLT